MGQFLPIWSLRVVEDVDVDILLGTITYPFLFGTFEDDDFPTFTFGGTCDCFPGRCFITKVGQDLGPTETKNLTTFGGLHSLRVTAYPWKMVVAKLLFILGRPIFRGELLVLGRVHLMNPADYPKRLSSVLFWNTTVFRQYCFWQSNSCRCGSWSCFFFRLNSTTNTATQWHNELMNTLR